MINALGYVIKCQNRIELGNGATTTCTLDEGHAGACAPPRPPCDLCLRLVEYWREHDAREKKKMEAQP